MKLNQLFESLEQTDEGYAVLPNYDAERYGNREHEGLEGPMRARNGKVVYYDKKEGLYYDPDRDMFIAHDEWEEMNNVHVPYGDMYAAPKKFNHSKQKFESQSQFNDGDEVMLKTPYADNPDEVFTLQDWDGNRGFIADAEGRGWYVTADQIELAEAAQSPYAIGMAKAMQKTGDKPPLKKSTITKAHEIARAIEKEETNEDAENVKSHSSRVDRVLRILRAKHPQAQSDLEALLYDYRVGQAQDRKDINTLYKQNDEEERSIDQIEKDLQKLKAKRGMGEGYNDYLKNKIGRASDEFDVGTDNYEVKIDGKPWKVFRTKSAANKAASTIEMKYGKKTTVFATRKPVSESLQEAFTTAISFPDYFDMSEEQRKKIIDIYKKHRGKIKSSIERDGNGVRVVVDGDPKAMRQSERELKAAGVEFVATESVNEDKQDIKIGDTVQTLKMGQMQGTVTGFSKKGGIDKVMFKHKSGKVYATPASNLKVIDKVDEASRPTKMRFPGERFSKELNIQDFDLSSMYDHRSIDQLYQSLNVANNAIQKVTLKVEKLQDAGKKPVKTQQALDVLIRKRDYISDLIDQKESASKVDTAKKTESRVAENIDLRHDLKPGTYKHKLQNIQVSIDDNGSVTFMQPAQWEIEGDQEYLEYVESQLAMPEYWEAELDEGGFFDPDKPNIGDMVKHRNGATGKVKKIGTQGDETHVYFRDQNGEMNYGQWKKHVFPVDSANKVKLKGFGPDSAKGNMGNPSARAALGMPKNEELDEAKKKPVPTDPEKWSYAKSQAKKKFDVYPSAYANAWAAKKYKELGGGWRMGKKK